MNFEIIVIGEKCIDEFIIGEANRLSPEAPVPVLNPIEKNVNEGMAANVAHNICSLNPSLNVLSIHQTEVIKKTRFVDKTSGYILIRVDENDIVKHRIKLNKFKGIIRSNKSTLKAIVISDYNKGFMTEEDIAEIIKIAKEYNLLVFLDTKKILGLWSISADFIKINSKEFSEQKKYFDNPEKYSLNLIVTQGANGSYWVNRNILVKPTPNEVKEVRDVAGAGDTYLAAFVVEYIKSNDVMDSMLFANKAATFAVSKQGVVAVKKEELI